MIAANYSEFKINMNKFFDEVEENNENFIIKKAKVKVLFLFR